MNDVFEVMKNRRSVRGFADGQIKQDELDAILEAGMYAPSAGGKQAWHFTVIQNQRVLDEISNEAKSIYRGLDNEFLQKLGANENAHLFFRAPTVVVISGEVKSIAPNSDCAVAAQNVMLAAEAMHIGSCWISAVLVLPMSEEGQRIIKSLGIPDGYAPYNSIALGYKKAETHKAPPRREGVVNYVR